MERTKFPPVNPQIEFLAIEAFKSSGFLIVNKTLIQQLGLLPAILLSNYIDKHTYFRKHQPDNDGWFYLTHEQQMEQIGIGEYSVIKYKNLLKEKGILQTERRGIPAKEWFKIDFQKLMECLQNSIKTLVPVISRGQDTVISRGHTIYKKTKTKETKNIKNTILENLPITWSEDESFQEALDSYLLHRKQKHQTPTPEAAKRMGLKLSKYSIKIATQALAKSVDNGWTGIFPESTTQSKNNHNPLGSRQYSKASVEYVKHDKVINNQDEQ